MIKPKGINGLRLGGELREVGKVIVRYIVGHDKFIN